MTEALRRREEFKTQANANRQTTWGEEAAPHAGPIQFDCLREERHFGTQDPVLLLGLTLATQPSQFIQGTWALFKLPPPSHYSLAM